MYKCTTTTQPCAHSSYLRLALFSSCFPALPVAIESLIGGGTHDSAATGILVYRAVLYSVVCIRVTSDHLVNNVKKRVAA